MKIICGNVECTCKEFYIDKKEGVQVLAICNEAGETTSEPTTKTTITYQCVNCGNRDCTVE